MAVCLKPKTSQFVGVFLKLLNFLTRRIFFKKEQEWLDLARRKKLNELREFLVKRGFDSDPSRLRKQWGDYLDKEKVKEGRSFYLSWKGKKGAAAVAANVFGQLDRPHLVKFLNKYTMRKRNLKVLDFGCGSAVLTVEFFKQKPDAKVYLADVENLNRDFVRYQIKKRSRFKSVGVKFDEYQSLLFDLIICNDVLEHLENPSEIFLKLYGRLKKSGLLFLEAPWGGEIVGHLPQAKEDWQQKGGQECLERKFVKKDSYYFYPVRFEQGVFQKR